MEPNDDKLMTPKEVRFALSQTGVSISKNTLARWIRLNAFKGAKKIGRNWHIPSKSVDEVLKNGFSL